MDNSASSQNKPKIERKADGTIVLNIVVDAAQVERVRQQIISELIKNVEAPGFRKGAVPHDIAEKQLNPEEVREEMLKKILTDEYIKAVREQNLNPIINPRIHIEQFTQGTDLKFSAETCELPEVVLGDYKAVVKKIAPSTPKIIVPGQEAKPEQNQDAKKNLDQKLEKVLSVAKITIPTILIENETGRLLSQLLDELKRLGVTLDQYLASHGKNEEALRAEYNERAEKDLKLEFMLRKIADDEKITVLENDIKSAIDSIRDEKQKAELIKNPYLVAAIIRQQKTLDFLANL